MSLLRESEGKQGRRLAMPAMGALYYVCTIPDISHHGEKFVELRVDVVGRQATVQFWTASRSAQAIRLLHLEFHAS